MIDRNIFSDRLIKLRKSNNVTIVDIAKQLNITKQSVNTWEKMKTIPTADKLLELADYFNVSIDYLVGRSDDPTRH